MAVSMDDGRAAAAGAFRFRRGGSAASWSVKRRWWLLQLFHLRASLWLLVRADLCVWRAVAALRRRCCDVKVAGMEQMQAREEWTRMRVARGGGVRDEVARSLLLRGD